MFRTSHEIRGVEGIFPFPLPFHRFALADGMLVAPYWLTPDGGSVGGGRRAPYLRWLGQRRRSRTYTESAFVSLACASSKSKRGATIYRARDSLARLVKLACSSDG